MSARVRMYTTSYCPYCMSAKRLLRSHGVDFEDVDVSRNPAERARITAETGHTTVPMIFVDDRFLGGSDELHEFADEGGLEPLKQPPIRSASTT